MMASTGLGDHQERPSAPTNSLHKLHTASYQVLLTSAYGTETQFIPTNRANIQEYCTHSRYLSTKSRWYWGALQLTHITGRLTMIWVCRKTRYCYVVVRHYSNPMKRRLIGKNRLEQNSSGQPHVLGVQEHVDNDRMDLGPKNNLYSGWIWKICLV